MLKILPISLLIGLLISGCRTHPPDEPKSENTPPTVGAFGTLIPKGHLRNLAPTSNGLEGSGVIDQLMVQEGDRVHSGQALARFRDHQSLLAERRLLITMIEAHKQRLNESQDVLKRFNRLAELGAYPLTSFQERVILYEGIANQLSEAQLRLEQNSSRLRNSILTAPFSGVVTRVYVRNGETSGKNGVLQIGDLDQLTAELEVYESDLKRISPGQLAFIRSDTGSFVGTVSGRVIEVLPGIRERTTLPTTAVPTVDVRVGIVRVAIDPKYVSKLGRYIGTKLIAKIQTP